MQPTPTKTKVSSTNIIDRVLMYLSPARAARRLYARQIISNHLRSYDAAGKGRRWKNLKSSSADAEAEVRGGYATARNRARSLVRNNWIAGRGVDALVANTVGHGIELSVENKKVMRLWDTWARTNEIDVNGTLDIFGLQQLAFGTVVESGDVLIKKVREPGGIIPLKIQVLEGDYIDTGKNETTGKVQVRDGIEFDSSGRVTGYYLYDSHPGAMYPINSLKNRSTRYSTDDVRLVYRMDRVGQVRGITWLARAMLKIMDLEDYDGAQLFRQKIAACFAGFIESDIPLNDSTVSNDPISEKLEPGIIEVLPPGKRMSFSQPPGVGADYDPFTKRQLQSIASSLGVTYEALTGDYSNVNFSSARMAWIEMHRNIEKWRWGMFVPMFCEVVYSWFLEASEIAGLIDSTRVKPPIWTPPRREMIDPVKETTALKDAVRCGFVTYSEALREMGKDPERHMQEIADDAKRIDSLNLTIEADPRLNLKAGTGSTSGDVNNDTSDAKN